MRLSIVTTMYRSAPYLVDFYERATRAATRITPDYECIFVNDGSPDDSLGTALSLRERDPRVRIIDLSRNFGHHRAMMTGLEHARGDLVFLVDCDLEEPPELLELFWEAWQSNNVDVVYGVQDSRNGSFFKRHSGDLFYYLFNLLSEQRIPRNVIVARLMSKRYVANLVAHRERELVIVGLCQATGFAQLPIVVHKGSKPSTTYSIGHRLGIVLRSITAFSSKPLVYIAYLGTTILGIATLAIICFLVAFLFGHPPDGYTSLMVSLWFLGGLIIATLGIIAIYLSVIFTEIKDRPYTIIRDIYGTDEPEP
jgi:putative glycosyltransferase